MFNSNALKCMSYTGGGAFVLCLIAMLAGGITWGTGAAGWLLFLSLVLSAGVALFSLNMVNKAEQEKWRAERRDTIDRMEDAVKCIAAEEKAHNATKRELVDVRQQLTTANALASDAKREYGNMRDRAAERGRTIDELQGQISKIKRDLADSNDTWRKQVSNMRAAALNLYCALDTMKFNNDDLDAVQNLMDGLRELAEAGGVPEVDARQVTIDEAIAEPANPTPALVQIMGRGKRANLQPAPTGPNSIEELQAEVVDSIERVRLVDYSQDLPQCQPSPLHAVHVLMAKVRANQQQRRANLDTVCKAVEDGYDLSQAITIAYTRGPLWVSDELISDECALIEKWRQEQANRAAQQQH